MCLLERIVHCYLEDRRRSTLVTAMSSTSTIFFYGLLHIFFCFLCSVRRKHKAIAGSLIHLCRLSNDNLMGTFHCRILQFCLFSSEILSKENTAKFCVTKRVSSGVDFHFYLVGSWLMSLNCLIKEKWSKHIHCLLRQNDCVFFNLNEGYYHFSRLIRKKWFVYSE